LGGNSGDDREFVAAAAVVGLTLPDRPGFRAVVRALDGGGGATRLVGGAVRDTLIGHIAQDIDLATTLDPEEVIRRLERAGIKAVPTGIAHGTVTAVTADCLVEVTTLRRDVSTDGRRATVAFTDDWQEDAARRDFTINALYSDPASGAVFDYFGGVDDLNAGLVRFIGEPLQRIAEDHLRILRFFRFHARFGKGAPDAASLAACAARANDLMALSRERIADELIKILGLPDPNETIRLMISHGIFAPVLPEIISADPLAALSNAEARAGIAPDALRRLAALLPADPARAESVAHRLKLSKAANKRLVAAAGRAVSDKAAPRALAYRAGTQAALDRLLLIGAAVEARAVCDWPVPVLPVSGGDIVARGVKAGPDVAQKLREIETQWIAEDFPDAVRVIAMLNAIAPR
jgi:poly(A) polymerase